MKNVLINGRFLSKPIGGVQRYAREIVKALSQIKQTEYNFVLITHRGELVDPPANIDVVQDDSFLTGHLWEQIRLPYLARKQEADILWSPCNVGPVFTKRHIVTIHDTSVFAGPEWFSKKFSWVYRFLLPILGQRTERVITDSQFSKTELMKYGIVSEEKIRVVPGGVSQSFFSLNGISIKKNTFPYVLAMGSGDPRKNISLLIKAWIGISPSIKQGRKLIIYGGGGNVFSKEMVNSIPSDVQFIGYVNDNDLPILYKGAYAFFYPSLYEGFGLPPLEAMACGCPVVASNVASLPEVCGDAAYYVDPYNVDSIAEGICKVLIDKNLRHSLVNKGTKKAKLFSWEKAAKEILIVFDEIVANRGDDSK